MEVQERRRRTTLSDQLTAAALEPVPSSASKLTTSSSSPNLRDLLKVRQEEDLQQRQARSRRSASISLGTFLACEKWDLSSPGPAAVTDAAAAISGRTLLDIIRYEDEESGAGGGVYDGVLIGGGNGGHKISWRRAFKERLRIRRSGNPVEGVLAAGLILPPPASVSQSGIPVPEDNPVRAGDGDAILPTEPRPSTRMAAADLPNGAASAGEQVEGSSRGGSPTTPATGEAEQQQQAQQVRVSLMALLEQTDRQGGGPGFAVSALLEEGGEEEGKMQYVMCCVCMVRHKGAAFIPCGHTFCRLCSRELWVSRGNCPLCNGFILEVLDIF